MAWQVAYSRGLKTVLNSVNLTDEASHPQDLRKFVDLFRGLLARGAHVHEDIIAEILTAEAISEEFIQRIHCIYAVVLSYHQSESDESVWSEEFLNGLVA